MINGFGIRLFVGFMIGTAVGTFAQDPSPPLPPDLKLLVDKFTETTSSPNELAISSLVAQLEEVETRYREAAAYKNAGLAYNLIQQAENGTLSDPRSSGRESIQIDLQEASISGEILREKGSMEGWHRLDSQALWEGLEIEAGSYDITLSHSSGRQKSLPNDQVIPQPPMLIPAESLDLVFTFDSEASGAISYQIPITLERPNGSAMKGGQGKRVTQRIEIDGAPLNFSINTQNELVGRTLKIHKITLQRIEEELVTNSGSPPIPYKDLKGYHETYLRDLGRPVVASYLQELSSLDESYLATGNTSASQNIRSEAIRVNSTLENSPADLLPFTKLPDGISPNNDSLPTQAGRMQALRNVQLIDSPDNKGDLFRVKKGDREFGVRLYFVECPLPAPEIGITSGHPDFFGITSEQAFRVGREAAKFTSRILSNRQFHLQTRGDTDDDGNLYAMAVIPGIGPLQQALLSRGLASPTGKSTKINSMQAKEYLGKVLEQAIKQAKENQRGGWGFKQQR